VLLLSVVVMVGAARARDQAKALIAELKSIDTAEDPTAVSRLLMAKYSNRRTSTYCERDFCQYHFLFTNGIISKLPFVPRAEIRMYMNIYAGSLSAVNIAFSSEVLKADSPVVEVQEDFCASRADIGCEYFAINPHGRDVGQTWNGDVEFGQEAAPEQKRAAWALNSDCFTAFSGCKDISQILPTVWKKTAAGSVSSRMRSTADSIAEASQPLPQ
jgi:hypothetical protein